MSLRRSTRSTKWPRHLSAIAVLAATATLAVAVTIRSLHLREANLQVPLHYFAQGDLLIVAAWVKGVAENGWYLVNPRLSAPGVQEFYDFPLADALHFALIRLLSWVTASWSLAMNLYYVLGFPMAASVALLVFRRLGFSYPAAMVSSLLFAFAPYHFIRGQNHMFLSSYYLLPTGLLLAYWCWLGEPVFRCDSRGGFPKPTARGWVAAALGLLMGSAGVYYAFFTAYFCFVAGMQAVLRRRTFKSLQIFILVAIALGISISLNVFPSFRYWAARGPNPEVARRYPQEAELYGLKMIQLLLPTPSHRLTPFADARAAYDRVSPLVNENVTSSLGLVGSAGFLMLVGIVLFRAVPTYGRRLLVMLSTLNAAALLLGTIGGFGAVFAWVVTPKLRAYNRVSIYILLFSLAAVGLILDWCWRWLGRSVPLRIGVGLAFALLTGAALLDQVFPINPEDNKRSEEDFLRDARFFALVEARLGDSAAVVQLPHMSYPEHSTVVQLRDYEHFRPYLHTRSLRFSYGAVRGRYWDVWLRELVSGLPSREAIEALALAGFDGALVDRLGYADGGRQICEVLQGVTGPPVAADSRYVCYDLRRVRERLEPRLGSSGAQTTKNEALFPVQVRWRGFHGLEVSPGSRWRWAPWRADLVIENPGPSPRTFSAEMLLLAGHPSGCQLLVTGRSFRRALVLSAHTPSPLNLRLQIQPGVTTIRFEADGERLVARGDPRVLVFRVVNPTFSITSLTSLAIENAFLKPRVVEIN